MSAAATRMSHPLTHRRSMGLPVINYEPDRLAAEEDRVAAWLERKFGVDNAVSEALGLTSSANESVAA